AARADAVEAVAVARAGAPEDLRDLPDDGLTTALEVARDDGTGLLAVLARVAEVEAGLPARRAAVAADEASLQDLLVEQAALEAARAERPEGRLHVEASLAEAREAAEGVAAAEAAVGAAEQQLEAADDAAALAIEAERAASEAASLSSRAAEAVRHEAALRTARLAGIAGELATTLADGERCVVCGSPDHPAPASIGADHVDDEQVAAAEAARAAAEAAASTAGSRVVALHERAAARLVAAGGLDPEAAKVALLAAQDHLTRARAAVRRRTELERQLVRHDEETVALDQRLSALTARISGERARIDARHRQIDADAATVATELDGCASVAERVAAVRARALAVGRWLDALSALERAHADADRCEREVAAALAAADLPDAPAARAASAPGATVAAWTRRADEHRQALATVEAGLAEPVLRDLAEDATADVETATAAHEQAEAAATEASQDAARVADRARAAQRAVDRLRAALAGAEHLRREAVPVVRMADLAAASGGDNAKSLTLATYVLARRFEDVVAAANTRLTAMSAGRFELVRSEEKEAVRARRTGLAMKVVDHHIEGERDPRTLSGGETFYVSLCLALGLADVVTAEAGGTDLGTLFVDEGFGTLDAETLEVVLAELGRLREGGRVVGVVSHVDALKQSIAERVEVRRLPRGGSTLTVRA
ncbi:SbcC/MukB-like Walker B domain-containing protein, partial [Actinotalea sp. AC32]|nr:SbcC/MukB-like Walker B domain-containing protein [Actinotalea sp. AC32]